MEKFCEACCLIIIIILIYLVFRKEKFVIGFDSNVTNKKEGFIQTYADALNSKNYNFMYNAKGYSGADNYLKDSLHPELK